MTTVTEKLERAKAKAESTASVVPWWISFVLFWIFVKGCVAGGCTMQAGMTEVMKQSRQAWHDSAPVEEPK